MTRVPAGGGAEARGAIERLRVALSRMEEDYQSGEPPALGRVGEKLGTEGSALVATLVALPFLSPISLGPLTLAASVAIAALGAQVMLRAHAASVPRRLVSTPIPRPVHVAMTGVLAFVDRWLKRFSRPRGHHLVIGLRGRVICGWGLIAGAALLAVPIPLLPLTNTIPSIAIVCFALGWVERDGVLTLVGLAALGLATAAFTALALSMAALGSGAVARMLPLVGV